MMLTLSGALKFGSLAKRAIDSCSPIQNAPQTEPYEVMEESRPGRIGRYLEV